MSDMYSRRSFPAQSLLRCTHQPVWFTVVWGKEVSLVFFIVLFVLNRVLSMKLRMASNFKSSCLSLPSRACLCS